MSYRYNIYNRSLKVCAEFGLTSKDVSQASDTASEDKVLASPASKTPAKGEFFKQFYFKI